MLRPRLWFLAPVLLGLALLPAAQGQQGQWVHLGARQVDFRVDHDVVRATGEGRFKRIRLVVEGGDLEMFDVRITFGDGATFTPGTHLTFRAKSRSRVIDLPGAARIVRWIDFYYRSASGARQGKATVHLYGRR
jgi:hypothetical protein